MPRLPPVTSTVRPLPPRSFLIVASAHIVVAARLLLCLAIEDRLHRRQALDERFDRLRLGEAELRREQVVHVQLLAGSAGALDVEPQRERDADHEAGRSDAAHEALARRLDGEEM